ncbi:MAG TPA: penicillin-binding protein 2 [Bdellovibrionota bacterium]|nr:penicillin-binding protein 2 [Bdellovibrionota bacterium]
MLGQSEAIEEFQEKFPILSAAVLLVFVALMARLFYLQIYRGQTYFEFSQQQSVRKEKLPGPRGRIYDRHGRLLVDNRMQIDITINSQFSPDPKQTVQDLAKLVKIPFEKLWTSYNEKRKLVQRFESVTLIEDAPWETTVQVETRKTDLPGIDVTPRIRRVYLEKEKDTHLIGYLSEVNNRDLDASKKRGLGYQTGDLIGRAGLEKQWEKSLRGVDGARYVVVNAHGHRITAGANASQVLKLKDTEVEPKAGNNLVLTLDQNLQDAATRAMEGKMGAVVALDPRTGEVLTMLSKPSFDPNLVLDTRSEIWTSLVKNPYGPLRNKAIQDHFPPGSTFKVITALAGLKEKVVSPQTRVFCPGYYKFGSRIFSCHKKGGHGEVDLVTAIKYSCNVYFYNIAAKIGIGALADMAKSLGVGSKTGIELSGETDGLMPEEKWKRRTQGADWLPGETLSVALGQGATIVSVLQLAQAYAALVNGGNLYRPYIVSRVENSQGNVIESRGPELVGRTKLEPGDLDKVREGLRQVVNEPHGTGYYAVRSQKVQIGGKSGTAQVMSANRADLFKPCAQLPFNRRHHGWFAGFAPIDKPEIVVVAFGMHECAGSAVAGPIVKKIIEDWWDAKHPPEPQPALK